MRGTDKLAVLICRLFRNVGIMEPLGPVKACTWTVFMPFAGIPLVVNLRQGGTCEAWKTQVCNF